MRKDMIMKRFMALTMIVMILFMFVGCEKQTTSTHFTKTYLDLDDRMLSTTNYMTLYNGYYYYANPDDENRLYRMDTNLQNPQELSEHANVKMGIRAQSADGKIFYLQSKRTNDEETPFRYTLFCFDLKSNTEGALSERSIIDFLIHDDWIYYETMSPAQSCRMRLDGSENEALGKENPNIVVAQNLYACGDSFVFSCHESITRINYDMNEWKSFPGYSAGLVVYGSSIYSISYNDDYALEKYNAETMEYSDMDYIVDSGVDSFTIIGELLIYADEDGDILLTGIDGGRRIVLTQGYAPIASKDYLFYLDQDGKLCSMPLNYNDLVDML